ncbi:wolframin isoform X2 [Sitophilus oryzae]|nr:wolframin isoform X2 [Sitophilus oryzae]
MTQDEKIVRRAAKEIFASLSNGGEYITSHQLQKKILSIERGESYSKNRERKDAGDLETTCEEANGEIINDFDDLSSESEEETNWLQKSNLNNEKLTEDKVLSAAITFSHGHLPVVNNMLSLTEPNLRSLDHIPFVYWCIVHPILSLNVIYFKLIKFLGAKSLPFAFSRLNISLFIILTYCLINFRDFIYFLPTLVFYLSFIVMLFTTLQMLQIQRDLHEFSLWRGLFICYSNGNLNEHSFEVQFIFNHIKPYIWYFCSLLIHYFCYSITSVKVESEFTVISFCLIFMTLFGFLPKRRSKTVFDLLTLFSFAINVLARYPYETDPIVSQGWRFLDLNVPSFPSYVVGNGIEFCISFRSLLYSIIPIILSRMAVRDNWRGIYKVLLPHLVTLSWLQYFALCSHNATTYGLYRATLALVGSVLFLPLVGLMSVILPVAALSKWLISSNMIYTIGLFIFLLMICLAVCYVCAKTKYAKYTAIVQIVLMLVTSFVLLRSSQHASDVNIESKTLSWENFEHLCYKDLWEGSENSVQAQIKCSELENTPIFWEATITDVKLLSIQNKYKNIFDKFPKFIADELYCLYGKEIASTCDQNDAKQIRNCMIFQESVTKRCSLQDYNSYTYELTLKMSSSYWSLTPVVHLALSNDFTNFTLRLKEKDQVWFKGVLYNSNNNVGNDGILGSLHIYIKGNEIGCISCVDYELTTAKSNQSNAFSYFMIGFYDSWKFVLNVLFNPILIFR